MCRRLTTVLLLVWVGMVVIEGGTAQQNDADSCEEECLDWLVSVGTPSEEESMDWMATNKKKVPRASPSRTSPLFKTAGTTDSDEDLEWLLGEQGAQSGDGQDGAQSGDGQEQSDGEQSDDAWDALSGDELSGAVVSAQRERFAAVH